MKRGKMAAGTTKQIKKHRSDYNLFFDTRKNAAIQILWFK